MSFLSFPCQDYHHGLCIFIHSYMYQNLILCYTPLKNRSSSDSNHLSFRPLAKAFKLTSLLTTLTVSFTQSATTTIFQKQKFSYLSPVLKFFRTLQIYRAVALKIWSWTSSLSISLECNFLGPNLDLLWICIQESNNLWFNRFSRWFWCTLV